MEHSGLLGEARRVLGSAGSGRGYAPERVLCSLMHLLHGGGRCLSDIRVLRRDGLFDGDEVPCEDALAAWLWRLGGDARFGALGRLHRRRAQAALQPSLELAVAVATRLDGTCEEILALYSRRGECENRIKEWKSGFAAARLPCSRYQPNRAWTRLNALAYNLSILIRRLLCKPRRWQMRTVRWRFWQIAFRGDHPRAAPAIEGAGQGIGILAVVAARALRTTRALAPHPDRSALRLRDARPSAPCRKPSGP